jgi:hypothetical protein
MENFFWDTHHKEATKEGRKVEPFLKYKIFFKLSSQNTTEVFRKHLTTKKVRIKAWQENGDSAINMADLLGRQGRPGPPEAQKRVSRWPKSFYALEGHWHHQEWVRHAPRHHFIHRF